MKLKVTKAETAKQEAEETKPDSENPKEDAPQKSKKLRVKGGRQTNSQYNKYSGIVNDEGKTVKNPTETEAIVTMAKYMKNNQSDQSSKPSNVYRPEFSHLGLNYNRKQKSDKA